MPSKKPAAARKVAAKPVKSEKTALAPAPASPRRVWALPIAMLMLVVGAGGLWLAVRESSNAPQAATPAVTHAAVAPEPAAPAAHTATTKRAAIADATAAPAPAIKTVSATGCLQHAGDGFVLKAAEGPAVSKTRSWKSGFLKRTSPSIDLVDAGGVRLASHVGQRVTVSGPLDDGAMRVQSVHRVAAACQ